MTGSKSLGDTGFLQFLGLFQVIMANPVIGSWGYVQSVKIPLPLECGDVFFFAARRWISVVVENIRTVWLDLHKVYPKAQWDVMGCQNHLF